MKNAMKMGLVVLLTAVLVGCASTAIVPQPGKITLQEALKSVGEGLYEMKKAEKEMMTGLVPSEVTVTFNITAKGNDDGKLYVELSTIPVAGGTGKVGGEVSSKLSAERGNQITVKFSNLLLADKDKLITMKTPSEITGLMNAIDNLGIAIYWAPQRPMNLPK